MSSRLLFPTCNLRLLITSLPSSSSALLKFKIPRMERARKSSSGSTNDTSTPKSSAKVEKFQQVLHSNPTTDGGWQKCWEEGLTPWDLGQPTPVLLHLHEKGEIPQGRALIPGCGTGYDVLAIAGPERYVVGLDVSETAIENALKFSSSANGKYFEFLKTDFFTWHPTELFDFIFDYTFFCAIEPDLRSSWAVKMRDFLKPGGELMTLMFPVSNHEGGPPYKVSVADYEDVLHPLGFKAISIVDNDMAVARRKGAEKLGRWKRPICQSSL
ncbi:OLC1v1007830C1 [Oldenlandia corymbosa var. corymbosa]|uniref:OLC1v1007830C1 n=1 Tax=Oldenlandia corymbosa var. corymbosa TaxID=529605 RepID=A0AAV1DK71_OLDCO|nr:OLC1v1007830C1 [Oldenlandia corymbosa var. corymbosa]